MSDEYGRYLERLNQIVYHELVPKMAVFEYFTQLIYARHADPHNEEPLIWYLQTALHSDITCSLSRLVETGNGPNIHHFLSEAKQHLSAIPWKTPLSLTDIHKQQASLNSIRSQTERLRKRRNGLFAHYDHDFFHDPDKINQRFPFSADDAKLVIRTLQDIVSAHMWAFKGHGTISMEGFVYAAAERLCEKFLKRQEPDGERDALAGSGESMTTR